MARFYPLYVRRSDGKTEIVTKGKRKEPNQPTDDQLDQKPDKDGVSDFYREVAPDEPKHTDWRRKLGGMLARELNWKDKTGGENGYILVTLPEGYRLYEHVKKTERDGKLEVKSKTHAAGGNDRQDAYLYGHPHGRRKRFRSPGDFFPHLLWLCTDESGDPDNCSCKICTPEDAENIVSGSKVKADKTAAQTPTSNQSTQPMVREPSTQGSEPATKQAAPQAPQASQAPQAKPLPQPKSRDQLFDQSYHSFVYRSGELVWFKRGQAWGLGVVLRRWIQQSTTESGTNNFFYVTQPLSHPFGHPSPLIKHSDADMRPWLAWSVPKFTNDGLNDLVDPPRYDTVDWQGIMQRRYGNGDLEVDASILAAKAADSTYTLFGKNDTVPMADGFVETHYDGMYLGAEKIWVGDPVRLSIGSGTDIMVVHSILERRQTSAMTHQVLHQSCKLLGDVYTLTHVSHSDPQTPTPASPNKNPHLPSRLTQDLAFRNARSIHTKRMASFWKLAVSQHRVDLDHIKGRWYEASRILPILQPQQFEESARKGEVQESSLWMNSRGDCLNTNRPAHFAKVSRENIRKETRRDAFGKAIPPNAEILAGDQPPQADNVDPALEKAPAASGDKAMNIDQRFDTVVDAGVRHSDPGPGGLDEFMNLDDMDETVVMPSFGQGYGHQTGASGAYF